MWEGPLAWTMCSSGQRVALVSHARGASVHVFGHRVSQEKMILNVGLVQSTANFDPLGVVLRHPGTLPGVCITCPLISPYLLGDPSDWPCLQLLL